MNKQQLANKIWASANRMRSKIDANEYKDYILGLIFYKFLSDNEANYLMKNGWPEDELVALVEDYQDPDAKTTIAYCQRNIGYFISYHNLFSTWLKPDSTFSVADLSVALNDFDRLISENYKHVYSGIFKTLQAGLSKLGDSTASQTKALKGLIKLIKDIPTDGSQDYDVLGYVYEYLIGNFAANAGKKAGEFYTPHEVAILMSEIVAEHHKAKDKIEIYDPTSGSGSLLITIGKSVGRHIADKNRVKYYAQELKENTYNLTRMNLVMRGIQPSNINTRCADSLDEDWPIQETGAGIGKPLYVDAVVSNPPYSQHWDPTDKELDARFQNYGVAPKSKADYAFLLHELHHLKSDGILTIVLPHGVLFRGDKEDDGEGKIRKNLIEKNHIDAIIGLPANIFFGTGIPTLIMVLKQHRDNDDILIIDASKGFVKDGKNNKLRACDIKKIADTVRDRACIPGFSKRVSRDEIRANDYNLNIPRYVDSSEPETKYDIYATVFGGIPNSEINDLKPYWDAFPSLRKELFEEAPDHPHSFIRVNDVARVISDNCDVRSFKQLFSAAFDGFEDHLHDLLITNLNTVKELQAQDSIACNIFHRLMNIPLIDKYLAYQSLSDNWAVVTNDIEMIQTEGINAARIVEPAYRMVKRDDEEVEIEDGLKGRILPFELVQSVKFTDELKVLCEKENRLEGIQGEEEVILDSFSDDEVQEYLDSDDNNKLDKAKIKKDAKTKNNDVEPDTKSKLKSLVDLWEESNKLKKEIKTLRATLVDKTKQTIENLSDADLEYFLHKKWITPIVSSILSETDAELSTLENKISSLEIKYETPLSVIDHDLAVAQNDLSDLIRDLKGDDVSIKGLMDLGKMTASVFPQEGETSPRIRFKGFEEDWERVSFSDLYEKHIQKNDLSFTEKDIISVANMYFIPKATISNSDYLKTYNVFRLGDIAFEGNKSKNYAHGRFVENTIGDGIVSHVFEVFRPIRSEYDLNFWKYYINNESVMRRILIRCTKASTMMTNLVADDFLKESILVPSIAEQQKIGAFLSNLDTQILLQQQRFEKLKQIKVSCLDKMFV